MQFEYSDGDNFKAYFEGRKSHWIHAVVQYNPLVRPSPIFFKCCRWTGVSNNTVLSHVCFFGKEEFICVSY